MGSKRQSRLKAVAPIVARLEALNGTVISNGRKLVPGTAEYDRHMIELAKYLSEEELAGMKARDAQGS